MFYATDEEPADWLPRTLPVEVAPYTLLAVERGARIPIEVARSRGTPTRRTSLRRHAGCLTGK